MKKTNVHRYKLTNTNQSSSYYGNCEICNKHVSEVYTQSHENKVIIEGKVHWIYIGDAFGHEKCLLSKQEGTLFDFSPVYFYFKQKQK